MQIVWGWVNYFKLADMKNILKPLDEKTNTTGDLETLEESENQF